MIDVINTGGDADTTGALVGMLMGACFGVTAFPYKLRKNLEDYKNLIKLSDKIIRRIDATL